MSLTIPSNLVLNKSLTQCVKSAARSV
ncbi:BnaCnng19480D [Brassica napus]|uniref:BnaCnng19480D protein n=2 Tax=Brassica TaxID=3705 RepID=A0A078IMS8_BRANA|nr:BnaCnng19480D [Brassica napus]